METIQLDHEMKPETLFKLNKILAEGKIELSRMRVKGSPAYCYIFTQGNNGSRGMTLCSAIERLYDTVFAPAEEITVDGVVYVKKPTQPVGE